MATHKNITAHKSTASFHYQSPPVQTSGLWTRYLSFIDAQKSNAVAWWLGSLILHGCILVPLSFLLVYSLDGPTMPVLFISMTLFFINVIANMGGAAFRLTFNSFMLSIAIHLLMVVTILITIMG